MRESINKVAKNLLREFEFGNIQDINSISTKVKQLLTVAETNENFEALFRVKFKKEPVKAPHFVLNIVESLQQMARSSDEESQSRLIASKLISDLGECMLRRNVSDLPNFLNDTVSVNGTSKIMAVALSEVRTDFGEFVACLQSEDKSHSALANAITLEVNDIKALEKCGKFNLSHGRLSEFRQMQAAAERNGDYDSMYAVFIEAAKEQMELGISSKFINQFNEAVMSETELKLPHLSLHAINDKVSVVIDLISDLVNESENADSIKKLEELKSIKYDLMIELGAKTTQENMSREERERVERMVDSMETKLRF